MRLRTAIRRGAGAVTALGLGLHAAAWADGSIAPGGLRGLQRVRSADPAGHGVLETGLVSFVHTLDDTSGTAHLFSITALQFGYGLSPFFEIGAALPLRAYSARGAAVVPGTPQSAAGFGDLETGVKLQLPLPGRVLRLGAHCDASFPTGSRSRGFSSHTADVTAGGLATLDFSRAESFLPVRLHANVGYRWNRNETDGTGLAPLGAVGNGGFWPPAYPPSTGHATDYNDPILYRFAVEFATRRAALFTELAYDDYWQLDVPKIRQQPWILSPGALVKFANGINLKAAMDISLQRDDAPPEVPQLPDWRYMLSLTWRGELSWGDPDHDGLKGAADKCPNEAEDIDGFEDDDGCPDLDNDGDGVPDSRDLAPNLPEDHDGFQDEDGRPDLDNDDDGIRDVDDQCPNEPEDYDGDRDGDGCPDDPPGP